MYLDFSNVTDKCTSQWIIISKSETPITHSLHTRYIFEAFIFKNVDHYGLQLIKNKSDSTIRILHSTV